MLINIEEKVTHKLPGDTSLFITFDYNSSLVDIMKSLSGNVYDAKTKEWETPLHNLSKLLVKLSSIGDVKLKLLEDSTLLEDNSNINLESSQFKTPPFNYQLDGIKYGLTHDKFLLLDAPGLGKTLQIIYTAQELKKNENLEHCLIICGVNSLKYNWKNEIHKHSDLSCRILGERVSKRGKEYIGSIADRLEDLKHPIEEFFIITNVETLRNENIVKYIEKGPNNIDMVALDESHHCKEPSSQQSKGLLKIKSPKHKIAMTGTILTNSPLDAYVPLKWLGYDRSTFTNFKYHYCTYTGTFNNILVGYKNVDILKDQLEKYGLRRTNDLLDLPEKTIIDEYVDLNSTQEEFYKNIVAGVVDQVDKVNMSVANLLAMVGRLRQATACPSILTTDNIPSSKIERACDLIDQITAGGDKVVVFSTYKETLNVLQKELQNYKPLVCTGDVKEEIINDNIIKFQNDPEYKVLLATHQKLGTGVTLTAANYAIFIDTPWTAADYEQAQDRIHRIGSKKHVFIYNLICKDTIDERVKEIVESKEAISDYIVDDKIQPKLAAHLKKILQSL